MAFDFENEIRVTDSLSDAAISDEAFSLKCDALVFHRFDKSVGLGEAFEMLRKDASLHGKCRHLESLGYFEPGFYMLYPEFYLGLDSGLLRKPMIINNFIFAFVGADADLENISFRGLSSESIENLPIVVFRNYRGDVKSGAWTVSEADLAKAPFSCQCDLQEFLGVFKAEPIGEVEFRLVKIFNRFYFSAFDTRHHN